MEDLYLSLIKKCITRKGFEPGYFLPRKEKRSPRIAVIRALDRMLRKIGYSLVKFERLSEEEKLKGQGWPAFSETMMGIERLNSLQACVETILSENIEGDFFEAGCWRGGAVIFMLAMLKVYKDGSRIVWAADSFQGYPAPSDNATDDERFLFKHADYFAVTKDLFINNVKKYDLYSDRLKVLEGYFSESIPKAPIKKLSLIRIDVDGYDSTTDVLNSLYPRLSPGGYVIIEDMETPGCRRAVEEFCKKNSIDLPIFPIPQDKVHGGFWRKDSDNKFPSVQAGKARTA
jgi:O-methyltransferase